MKLLYIFKSSIILEILFFIYFLITLPLTLIYFPSINLSFQCRVYNELLFKPHYILLIIIIINIKKIPLSNLNISCKNLKSSILIGFLVSLIPILLNGNNVVYKVKIFSTTTLIWCFIYNFIVVGFYEEFIFRGFIQNALNNIFKDKVISALMGSLCFAIAHLPVNILIQHNSFKDILVSTIGYICFHLGAYFLTVTSKNLITATVFHGVIDFI